MNDFIYLHVLFRCDLDCHLVEMLSNCVESNGLAEMFIFHLEMWNNKTKFWIHFILLKITVIFVDWFLSMHHNFLGY